MHPLVHFSNIFPSNRLVQIADELRYCLPSVDCSRAYEFVARRVILAKGLPLVAMLETWQSRGCVREIALVVKEAPEADPIERQEGVADEVQDDEGLTGGWWNTKEQE